MYTPLAFLGRTTPFIFLTIVLGSPALAEPRGHWRFVEDDTRVELRSCVGNATALCGVVTRLPDAAAGLAPHEREALCGTTVLGDLRPEPAGKGERARFLGWVLDLDAMTAAGNAPRYAARLVVLSEDAARLEVRGAFGIVLERLALTRAAVPTARCE